MPGSHCKLPSNCNLSVSDYEVSQITVMTSVGNVHRLFEYFHLRQWTWMDTLPETRRRVVTIRVKIPPRVLFAPLKTAQTLSLQQ